MATEADLIQKFKDLNIPVGADFEELIHEAFIGANLVEQVNSKADDSKVVHNTGAEGISGQKMFDVAPIDKTTGNPYITRDGVPTIDLSNYATQQQLATKADDSKVVHDNHDGSVQVNGVSILPLNGIQDASQPYGLDLDKYKDTGNYRFDDAITIHYPETFAPQYLQLIVFGNHGIDSNGNPGSGFQIAIQNHSVAFRNMYTPNTWNAWRTVATQTDVTTAISTATANMVDPTKATNFTAGLQSGGVNVATAADLKSLADKAWYMKSLPDVPALKNISLLYQVDNTNKKMNIVLNGSYSSATAADPTGLLIADFSDIIQGITGISIKSNTNRGGFLYYDQSMQQSPNVANNVNIVFSGTKLYMNTGSNTFPRLQISGADYLCLMYGSTISYTELV